ncbi:uncharacterized protein [Triticum aestivum]|uniref:uncharacterized protein isoform X2 n=1 Tax=Triticum aestivum TaxID=4565 RepID=UPI001D00ED5E|nr:uncharacterized protein LOC123070281 isoform X2 [Triticum aestivum]
MAGICAPKYEFGRAGSSIAGKTYTLYKRRWWKTNKCYYWCTPSSRILPCSSIHWLRPPPAAARLGSATSNLSWASAGFSVPNVAAGLPAAWLRFPLQMRCIKKPDSQIHLLYAFQFMDFPLDLHEFRPRNHHREAGCPLSSVQQRSLNSVSLAQIACAMMNA